MKNVNDLIAIVSYRVELEDVNLPDEVYNEMKAAQNNGDDIDPTKSKYPKAAQWLLDNIKEGDSTDWEVELEHVE